VQYTKRRKKGEWGPFRKLEREIERARAREIEIDREFIVHPLVDQPLMPN
jgi:hypothetical protein